MGSKAKRQKKIPKPTIERKVFAPPLPNNKEFTFYSCYKWIHAVDLYKKISFTNMCKDKECFADEIIRVLTIIIPKLYQDWEFIFKQGGTNKAFKHCHVIKGEELTKSVEIAETIHDTKFDTENSWWELGFSGGVRIIGIFDSNSKTFYPLFVDRHHLIYPDNNFNHSDFEKYDYNPRY